MTAREESPLIVALSETVEIRTAQRDRALVLLLAFTRMQANNQMMSHLDQRALREANSLLVEAGVINGEIERLWVDRICTCTKLADGTNATHVNPACVVHGGRL